MYLKALLSILAKTMDKLPTNVILTIIIFFQGMWISVDYYIIDLTPSVGTIYQQSIENLEEKIDGLYVECRDPGEPVSPIFHQGVYDGVERSLHFRIESPEGMED